MPLRSCSVHLPGGRLTSVLAGHSILPSEFPGSRPPESAKVMTARLRVATVSSLLLLIAIPTVGQSTSAPAARTEGDCPLAKSNPAGVPYSALVEITLLQTLADGTHIESKQQSTQVYHDSHGRLRQEFKQPFFGPTGKKEEFLRYIMITDPVACVTYNLDVSAHVAHTSSVCAAVRARCSRSLNASSLIHVSSQSSIAHVKVTSAAHDSHKAPF